MKTLKYFSLVFLMLFSVRVMAQSEIKMHTGSVNIGEGKTYYFFDSGGEEEFTAEEDPNNDYRWKTMYQHNETHTLVLKVPQGSTKGIKVTFRTLLINDDNLRIFNGTDTTATGALIADLTTTQYSTSFRTFSVMSKGDMTIRFHSNGSYRDAGWEATVELGTVDKNNSPIDYAPQAPVGVKEACANYVHLLPTSKGKIHYTIDGSAPTANSPVFEFDEDNIHTDGLVAKNPILITNTTRVRAITVEDNVASEEFDYTFDTEMTHPNTPYITRIENTNNVKIEARKPGSLNDTWYVRFTTDDNNPTGSAAYKAKDDTIITLTQPCTLRVVTQGTVCENNFSTEATEYFGTVYTPAPVINVAGKQGENDGLGSGTITCEWDDATIYYTLDGTLPSSTNNDNEDSYKSPISLSDIPVGTTITAVAHMDGSGYMDAKTVFVYMPKDEDGNAISGGVFGTTVFLDDREDHSWSYYKEESPIHSLKPADVKITYYGYGDNTMTSTNTDANNIPNTAFDKPVAGSAVAVNVGENENQFIYLKTLENAKEDGSGNYPYTMIPNPFQKRPTYGTAQVTTSQVYISGSVYGNNGLIRVTYFDANGVQKTWQSSSSTSTTLTVKDGTQITLFAQGRSGGTISFNRDYSNITARYTNSSGNMIGNVECTSSNYTNGASDSYTVGVAGDNHWRGFYAWRVKSMSSGLSIKAGNTTYTSSNISSGIILYADQDIEFVTSNQEGNEVEFEALWAQAWVNKTGNSERATNSGNYQNAYERNFKVGTSITTYNYPVTFSTINPDGSGTAGTVNQGNYTCSNDVKFENMTISGAGSATYTAAGHNLIFGRGISGTVDYVRGINANTTSPNYHIRLESGTFNYISILRGYSTANNGGNVDNGSSVSGTPSIKATLGCDYDRATNSGITDNLIVNNCVFYGYGVSEGNNISYSDKALVMHIKSGKIGKNFNFDNNYKAQAHQTLYIGIAAERVRGHRQLFLEGGEVASIAGGIDATQNANQNSVTFRMTGGHVRGCVYGAAARSAAYGNRNLIVTGGTITGWIGGGCNGEAYPQGSNSEDTYGGITNGFAKVYFGGNAICGGNGSDFNINGSVGGIVFGAGKGLQGNTTSGRMNSGTAVVIADKCNIERNVYGGGNYGYALNSTEVHVLGGTVQGDVFGGSNENNGPSISISMKGGTIKNLYGGSNNNGTISSNVIMNITGGEVKGNVFGGGYGNQTRVSGDITINIGEENSENAPVIGTRDEDGNLTEGGNVYGGSALGLVNTNGGNAASADKEIKLTVYAGSINNVFGGGLGNSTIAANVGKVTVNIEGGKINKVFGCNDLSGAPQGMVFVNFNGGEAVDVYGGGYKADYRTTGCYPTVNINGGKVTNNVFGGGSLAEVNKTIVNMTGGEATRVFAGAEGETATKTLVYGNKTFNMKGGSAITVYGGSFTCQDQDYSFVNISGGRVKTHVFGSGYFGGMSGSCFVYIGKNAIEKAPNNGLNGDKGTHNIENPLWIEGNVYAGADWGTYDPNKGFGDATIEGDADIYIDGLGYNNDHGKSDKYIILGGSVYGCGTSCKSTDNNHRIIVRNYGNMTYPSMTRSLKSIQQATELMIDNSNIDFVGQGDITSMDPTVEYGMCNIGTIYAANGSNIALSKPMDMVHKLGSYTTSADAVYTDYPNYTNTFKDNNVTSYTTPSNGVVINNGGYLRVRYKDEIQNRNEYGELQGYFYMREPGDDAGINNEGYIFARPKYIAGKGEEYLWTGETVAQTSTVDVFATDGGFVAFTDNSAKNTFDADGLRVRGAAVQMAYTNRTNKPTSKRETEDDNNTDYRFWRFEPTAEFPISTRDIVFVVSTKEDPDPDNDNFLTTSEEVQLPPALGNHKYYITDLTWGVDGKDCTPASTTQQTDGKWQYFDYKANPQKFDEKTAPTDEDKEEYYGNPNSTFGFLMQFAGNLENTNHTPKILDNESYASYYKDYAHELTEVNSGNSTDLPTLAFLVTYSDRITQNEMWSEARLVIDEVEETIEEIDGVPTVTARTTKQRIYLNLSVTTVTTFGKDVETYVYASTVGNKVSTYTAQLTLPTFGLDDPGLYKADFKVKGTNNQFAQDVPIQIVQDNKVGVENESGLALKFYAAANEDNTDGWKNKGNEDNPSQAVDFDFKTVTSGSLLGAADGRKYTTIAFELKYDPQELAAIDEYKLGQHYVGDLVITMDVTNVLEGEQVLSFDIIVHVYVTGSTKFYYLDGIAGRDGNTGMFPDQAKRTLNGILNANGYTAKDPIFVVNGVAPNTNSTLTWDANKFAGTGEGKGQVQVYRYPGGHYLSNGLTTLNNFDNTMFKGQMVNVPEGTQFIMHNVRLSGGSDLDENEEYNPLYNEEKQTTNPLEANFPLISIADGATVTITNSALVYNNNKNTNTTTALAGAIENNGTLTVDSITIENNLANGKQIGVYQNGDMDLYKGPIIVADQVYMTDKHYMTASKGQLNENSLFSDIMVYLDPEITDLTHYSGRVIVRYTGYEPNAPDAPFWKTIDPATGKPYKSTMLKSRKAAPEYESYKYELDEDLTEKEFLLANGGSELVLPYIVDAMKDEYTPTANDIIMYRTDANLPVELLYFHATCMGDAVQFEWSTASETNNEYFTIERSTDAVNYEEIARIQGAGTTSQRSDYSFMADNSNSGMTYYRLRQTDIDGKYEIFTPIALQCSAEQATDIDLYPVPARDMVNIISNGENMSRVEVYTIQGSRIMSREAEGTRTQINVSTFAAGAYIVKVTTETGVTISRKLIVR